MPRYVVERNIPGAGQLSPDDLAAMTETSCGVLQAMGPQIQWLESFVTDDKIYCIYIAPDEAAVREHAQRGGFPADSVAAIRAIVDPTRQQSAA